MQNQILARFGLIWNQSEFGAFSVTQLPSRRSEVALAEENPKLSPFPCACVCRNTRVVGLLKRLLTNGLVRCGVKFYRLWRQKLRLPENKMKKKKKTTRRPSRNPRKRANLVGWWDVLWVRGEQPVQPQWTKKSRRNLGVDLGSAFPREQEQQMRGERRSGWAAILPFPKLLGREKQGKVFPLQGRSFPSGCEQTEIRGAA